MGGQHSIKGTNYNSEIISPPYLPDYVITGAFIEPDCRGDYFYKGNHMNKPYYSTQNSTWFLFWEAPDQLWKIADALENPFSYWTRSSQNIIGIYSPVLNADGYPVVSAGI